MESKNRGLITFLSLLGVFILISIVYGREKNENMPRDIVYKFLTADSEEKSMEYVYEGNKPIEKKIETQIEDLSVDFKKNKFSYVMEQDLNLNDIKNGDYTRVKVYKNNKSGIYEDKINIFYLKKIDNGFKLDLNVMADNNDETLDEFILNENSKKTVIKVYAKLDNYNNISLFNTNKKLEEGISLLDEEKKNKYISKEDLNRIDKFCSITLKDPDSGIEIQGFLEKGNEEVDRPINYLKGDGLKQIVVEISSIDIDGINKVVKINSIKSLNWAF